MDAKKGYRAEAKFVRISPFKVRRIADLVRKKPYEDVVALLETLPHKGARLLRKVIKSAAANALYNNKELDEGNLYIRELQINEAVRLKRVWPRARGRADQLLKRSCHILVIVDEITGV